MQFLGARHRCRYLGPRVRSTFSAQSRGASRHREPVERRQVTVPCLVPVVRCGLVSGYGVLTHVHTQIYARFSTVSCVSMGGGR